MDKMKQWIVFAVVGALAILAGGWFLLVSPKHADASALKEETAAKLSSNQQLQTQLATLKAQAKDLPKQQAKLAAVAAKIPDNTAAPALVRALSVAAQDAGVELISIAPGAPAAVGASAAPAVTTAATSTTAAQANPAAGAAAAGTLQAIGVNINVVGGYFQVAEFLNKLEGLPRAFRVSSLNIAPGLNPVKPNSVTPADVEKGSSLSATIQGSVYMATGRTTYTSTTGK